MDDTEKKAALLNAEDVAVIQSFLDKNVGPGNPLTGRNIYAALQSKITSNVIESSFLASLSANVHAGYIVGVMPRRKVGYVQSPREAAKAKPTTTSTYTPRRKSDPPKANTDDTTVETKRVVVAHASKPIPVVGAAPLVPEKTRSSDDVRQHWWAVWGHSIPRHVWVERKLFRVPRTFHDIRLLTIHVLNGREDENGTVTFDGKKYSCPQPEIMERFLTHFLFAIEQGESDPVLNDETEVPVELRMS